MKKKKGRERSGDKLNVPHKNLWLSFLRIDINKRIFKKLPKIYI
jgi:hypothetical protein